jgi:acylphosphatase
MKERARIVVTGIVQGVFFRHHAKRKADELRLAGTVRNLPDGSVEVVCEGGEPRIRDMIAWCRRGPDSAHVTDVDVQWQEPEAKLRDFTIVY